MNAGQPDPDPAHVRAGNPRSAHCAGLALFVIVGQTPDGDLAIPAGSARVAAQVARHLTEHCPHTQASWQVSPHAGAEPVVVWGRARSPAGGYLFDPQAHAFLLAAGDVPPPVWVAVCGHEIADAEFDVLDAGTGRPCPDCARRWTSACRHDTDLPVRSPGQHLHPLLRRAPLADHVDDDHP